MPAALASRLDRLSSVSRGPWQSPTIRASLHLSHPVSIFRKIASHLRHILVQGAFVVFDSVLPVREDFWCFCTWQRSPHTLDNPRAVFEEVKDDPSIRKIVLQKDSETPPAREGANVHFVPAESFAGAYYLARSGVVLIGYALFAVSSYSHRLDGGRHAIIQLWHGIPLKRIGHLFPGEDFWSRETHRYAATVCSSERDREIMASAFSPIPPERVWLTGLPRNSLLLGEESRLPADYREHLGSLDRQLDGRRLVLYAPTWRDDPESLYVFSLQEEAELEALLADHDAVLGIRGHSNVRSHEAYSRRDRSGSIISVNDVPDVSVVLRRTDVLITDYSSIYIDFLLTERPIVHFAYDLDDYREERGFLYEPEEAFAGPTPRTFGELLQDLDEVLSDAEAHRDNRDEALRLFHTHEQESAKEVAVRIRKLQSDVTE